MILTKYKDFIGLASADRDDTKKERITKFLSSKGIDTTKYEPVGIATYFHSGNFYYSIICRNPADPTNKKLIKLHLNPEITTEEFYYLVDTHASIVVYNHDIDPNQIEEFTEEHIDTEGE